MKRDSAECGARSVVGNMGMRPTAVVKWSENMRRSQGSIEALSGK